jgi:integrase
MATIKERCGKYTVQVRKKGHKSLNKTFSTFNDADSWGKKVESEMERGVWKDTVAAENKTVADVLRMYRDGRALLLRDCDKSTAETIKEVLAKRKKENEQRALRSEKPIDPDEKITIPSPTDTDPDRKIVITTPTRDRIDVLIRRNPTWKKIGILNFAHTNITEYVAKRQAEGVTNGTIGRELDLISTAINRARAGGLPIQQNPIETIDRPEIDDDRDRRLQEGEMPALMNQLRLRKRNPNGTLGKNGVDNPYIRWIVRWCVETATRQGETLKLEWKHLHERRRFITLPANICKNGTARDVPLSTRALRILRVMKTLRPENEPRIFPTTRHAVKKSWERACERAGIDDLHFHDLRHEATSRLAERVNVLELASITGHKDLQSLKRYYHPKAENLAKKLA